MPPGAGVLGTVWRCTGSANEGTFRESHAAKMASRRRICEQSRVALRWCPGSDTAVVPDAVVPDAVVPDAVVPDIGSAAGTSAGHRDLAACGLRQRQHGVRGLHPG